MNWRSQEGDALRPLELDALLGRLIDELCQQFRADRATLYLVDFAREDLVSRVARLAEPEEIRLKLGEGVAGWVAQEGRSIRVPTDRDDPRIQRAIDQRTGYQTRSMLAVPLRSSDTVVGVIQLLNRIDGDFTASDETALETVAAEVAAFLDRSSLGSQLSPRQRHPLHFGFNQVVGDSPVMRRVYARTRRAAATEVSVLLRGESGTGKELVARAIHENSPRAKAPFVKVDCASLPESLLENELFGHRRGAYTGADQHEDGRVAAAEGGTLFIDEVGELPLPAQARLLRLVQSREWSPLGSNRLHQADVRFVFATHCDLEAMVAEGRFRQDLYYRIKVVVIDAPPLRVRGAQDLDRLIDHFLHRFRRTHHRSELALSDATRQRLHAHPWPGNVRELENSLEAAVVLSEGPELNVELGPVGAQPLGGFHAPLLPLRELERRYLAHVLEHCEGNQSAAARLLEIGRNTLARKLADESP